MTTQKKASKAAQRVREAEETFYRAHAALVEWEDEHAELMDEFRSLVATREEAREVLELAVADTGLPGGGMQISHTTKRTFDGEKLHFLIEDDALRARLVKVDYKVNTKEFDKALKEGELDKDIGTHVVIATENGIQIRKRPPKIVLG
jgi:hypothetical protein